MTSEPWIPIPYDPAPYECALDETPSHASSGLTADGVSPSAPKPIPVFSPEPEAKAAKKIRNARRGRAGQDAA